MGGGGGAWVCEADKKSTFSLINTGTHAVFIDKCGYHDIVCLRIYAWAWL